MNTTSEIVSTSAWVSARSGAPCKANSTTTPYPVTPSSTTALSRRRAPAAKKAPIAITSPTATWPGVSNHRMSPICAPPVKVAMPIEAAAVNRMIARYSGNEPRCVTEVTPIATRSSRRIVER